MKYIYSFILLIASYGVLHTEELEVPKYSAYSGRHFYVSFMENEIEVNGQNEQVQLKIFITAVMPTTYEIRIPGYETITGELKTNDVKEIAIPYILEDRQSEAALNKGIEITSEFPVSVYCFTSKATTSDSYSAIPISRWGKEYVVMSYPNDQYDDPERWRLDSLQRFYPRSSQFMVLAAYDSTIVSFSPRSVTKGGKQVGKNYDILLNKGQVYLVQSFPAERGKGDLTGTIVRSNKPIGLLSGHVRTAVPQTNTYPYDSKDHLCEMLAPTDTWGKFFCTVPFGVNIKGDLFRIAGIHPNTIVTYENELGETKEYILSSPGDWAEINNVAHAAVWRGNLPFQLVQYMRHTGEYGDSQEYDPSIVVIPPVEQYVQDIVFLTPRNYMVNNQFTAHKVSLIADAPALVDLSLDGQLVRDMENFYSNQIPGTSLYWGSIVIYEGRHKLKSSKGRFSGTLYAFGSFDSYAMALGNSLTNPFKEDSISPTININERCGFINGFVHDIHDTNSSGIDFGWVVKHNTRNYEWTLPQVSDTATIIQFSARPINLYQDGHFELEFYDKNSNAVKYVFSYKGIKISSPPEMLYPNLSWESKECKTFKVFNFGSRVMSLDSIKIFNEKRLTYTSTKTIPAVLNPGDTITFTLCFDPKGDSATLYTNIDFYFDCDYTAKMSVKGNVKAPKIAIQGYDFGEVRVGDTLCGTIIIENLGNTDLLIDKLAIEYYLPQFEYNDLVMLPINLGAGNSIQIDVCFIPTDTIYYETHVSANNDFDLLNDAVVKGRGVAPLFNSIVLDWGKRRIGTSSDSTMYFVNSGSLAAPLKFKSLKEGEHFNENVDVLKNINTTLQPNEVLPVNLTFNPKDTIPYIVRADFETDWALHKTIEVLITGQGTIPTIETFDFRFDTTRVFIDIDSTMLAIKSGGNERLTIDQIRPIDGDYESFDIDLAKYDKMIMMPGDEQYIPVTFTPKRVGEHRLLVEVIHDANPNYIRTRDTILISGYALPADTIDYNVDLVLPQLFACVPEEGYFEITNTGNIDINLQKIILTLTPDNFVAEFKEDVDALLPIVIVPDQTRRFDMSFYAERNQGGKLLFELQINDSISRLIEYNMMPIVTKIEVTSPNKLEVVPGDTVSLTLKGRWPMGVNPNVDAKFGIFINNYFVELINKNGIITLKDSKGTIDLPVQFVQSREKIEFNIGTDSLKISEETEWETKLVFLALLHDKDTTTLSFELISDKCFDPGIALVPIKFTGICNFPLRPIKLIANLPFVNIAPNPIISKIGIEVFLIADDEVSFALVDAMGKKTEIENLRRLNRGKHYLEYSSEGLSSGVYNLIMLSKQLNENIIFIITK